MDLIGVDSVNLEFLFYELGDNYQFFQVDNRFDFSFFDEFFIDGFLNKEEYDFYFVEMFILGKFEKVIIIFFN